MRFSRKLALGFGVLVALALVAVLALPLLFKDRITQRLRAQLNESVDARVDWTRVGIGALRDFPNLSLTVEGLTVVGDAPFHRDTLVAMPRARLALDVGSVFRYLTKGEPIVVREVLLQRPAVALRVLPDGRANWDIMRAAQGDTAGGSRAVRVTLRKLRIEGADLTLDDRKSRLEVVVKGLDETLSGDFSQQKFTLASTTRADSVSARFAGVPYLTRAALALEAELDADLATGRFTIGDASLTLNQLVLALSGSVTTGKPDVALDLKFATPGTAFRDIISLVPALYARNFDQLQTTGTMTVVGQVRGDYGPTAFPALAVRARVENGAFRHAGLPMPARDIAMELAIDNPGGDLDRTVVELKRFHAAIGPRVVDARFVMRTPVSDPDVELRLKGAVDLADVSRAVKLDGVEKLVGLLAADVELRTRLSDVDARRYDRVDARGTAHAARVAVRSAMLPHDVAIDTVALRFTPQAAELLAFAARVGSSDVRATGALDNLLGFVLRGDDLRGRASVASNHLDLNEWRSEDELTAVPVPARVDFTLDAAANRVAYGKLMLANVRGGVRIRDRRATLSDLRMEMLRGTVVANGHYETVDLARPTFDLDLKVASVDIPDAFAAVATVQQLAPVARWAQGSVSGTMGLRGTLRDNLMPDLSTLSGKGDIETERLAMQGAPVLGKLADALSLEALRNPSLGAVRMAYDIANGRLQVKPFQAAVAGVEMTVAGSNGIDQTLLYDLAVAVPRAANAEAVTRLASMAQRAGAQLDAGEIVKLGARLTGTVTDPNVRADFSATVASVRGAAQNVVQAGAQAGRDAVEARVDSAGESARQRAREEAERIVAEAERQAEAVRTEARALADRARAEAATRSDSLVSRATSPAARLAAQAAADKVRREADGQASRIVREADTRADALVAAARGRAAALTAAP